MDNTQQITERIAIENRMRGGASWFFWIAGLSVINSVIMIFGGDMNFVVGLGITQIVSALLISMGTAGKAIAIAATVLIAALFVLFGIKARQLKGWAFITGMIIYGLDGLLFLAVPDFLSIGFHVFALFFIFRGMQAARTLSTMTAAEPAAQTAQ